jgi:RNA polymerase sigma factor (sigma-70 family)
VPKKHSNFSATPAGLSSNGLSLSVFLLSPERLFCHVCDDMMANRTMEMAAEQPDAELVAKSLNGNRDAFETIVSRYQSLICSLAYSATGSVSRSEDLGQDVFLTAWRQLHTLREPDRVRPWLCGIARNLINNTFRTQLREPLHQAEALDIAHDVTSPEPGPSEQAIHREEETIVWSAVEQIPQNYREPLILFYRENQSVETVARQLDLSEDAVKQRLSRGREMLRVQVVSVVEGALKRSRPGRVFTLAVMAALPAVVAGSATAAGLGAAGKAVVPAAKAAFAAGAMGGLLGGLGGLLGGAVGAWASWQTARYQRQRNLLQRAFIVGGVGMIVFFVPLLALNLFVKLTAKHPLAYGIGLASWILLFLVANLIWAGRLSRQFKKITAEEIASGTAPLPETPVVRNVSRWASKWEGRQWRSRWSLLGWPLIDIQFSSPEANSIVSKATISGIGASKHRVARGWIALGDRAHGILFACGNIAIGGIAIGGICAGGLAFGGLAIGVMPIGGAALGLISLGGLALGPIAWGGAAIGAFAFGGLAVGWLAFGGAAFAWSGAKGGLACAHDYAVGGLAKAAHANDSVAKAIISEHWFFRAADWQTTHVLPKLNGPWFIIGIIAFSLLFPVLLFVVGYRRKKSAV